MARSIACKLVRFPSHQTAQRRSRWLSKSRGNLVFVSGLRHDGADPMAIRLALLAHHYRADWEWTADDLTAAETRLARWREAAQLAGGPAAQDLVAELRRHLSNDLDAPAALAAADRWVDHALSVVAEDREDEHTAPDVFRLTVDSLLGIAL